MTESMFTPEAESTPETSKRSLVLVAGLAGALVLGGGGYYFLLSGGTPTASAPVSGRVPHSAQPAAVKPTAVKPNANKPVTVLPPASTTPLGRDPFRALYIVPVAAAPVPGGTPATGTPPATGGTTPPGTSTTSSAPVAKTYALKLITVYGAGNSLTGDFSVAGKRQQAKAGSVFGRTQELKLLALQQGAKGAWTAVVQVGDGQPFDAAVGQTLYVL